MEKAVGGCAQLRGWCFCLSLAVWGMRRFTFLNLCLLLVGAAVVGGVVFWGTGPRHEVHGESNAAPATLPHLPLQRYRIRIRRWSFCSA